MVRRQDLWLIVLALITGKGHVECSIYSVMLLGMEIQKDDSSDNRYELLMINKDSEKIEVDIVNIESTIANAIIPANGDGNVFLDVKYGMNGTEYANKTLIVQSSGNFTLQVFSITPSHTEGLLAIPIDDLNGPNLEEVVYEYIISTFCGTSGYCQMGVAALEEANVKITFPSHVGGISFCMGSRGTEIFRSNIDSVLLIRKYHAVQIETTRDLTGTHVYSFKPIVVFVGSRNISMANGLVHTLEQMTPSSQWGTEFAISTLGDNDYGDILKISASWPNTEVNMTGYMNFIISTKDAVSRRLEKGSSTLITASSPIQVVQITGVDYATNDPSTSVAMVTVPATEHFTNKINISCGSVRQSGQFFVMSEKTKFPMIMGMQMSDVTGIPFTAYKTSQKYMANYLVYELYGTQMGGVAKCDNGAVLPMGVTHLETNSQNDPTDVPPAAETTCIDGSSGWISYERNGYEDISTIFYQSFEGFSVLKLRLITCGDVHVTINTNIGYVNYHVSRKQIFVTHCTDNGCDVDPPFEDGFNSNRECSTEMAWYWFRVSRVDQLTLLCLGFGPTVPKDDHCSGRVHTFTIYSSDFEVTDFAITPIFTPAYFNYDLETDEDCRTRISEWRCEDRIRNCSSYGTTFCSEDQHEDFAREICPKFCKYCFADSYGRKFVFPFTHESSLTIYITLSESQSRVGVTSKNNLIPLDGTFGQTLKYKTGVSSDVIWIVTEKDAAVTVVQNKENMGIQGFNVFPIDSFSTEHFLLPECITENCMCNIITEGISASVKAFPGEPASFSEIDGETFTVTYDESYYIEETQSGGISKGVKLTSDQPVGVYCGGQDTAENYAQVILSAIYGTFYMLPPLRFEHKSLDEIKLITKAVHPNTEIQVVGAGDDFHILETVGKSIELELNTDVSYTIQSNEPIVVGLQFLTNQQPQYIPVPPTSCYRSDKPLFFITPQQTQVAYVSSTGETQFMNYGYGVFVHLTNLESFGVLMWLLEDVAMFLPSYYSLVTFESQNKVCATTTSGPRDDKDNDCDGRTDEDICSALYGVYGIDGDLDGDFDGDCGDTIIEPVIVPELPPLVCQYIEQRFNRCWIAWKCPCSWVQSLQNSSTLTESEFNAIQLIKIKEIEERLTIATDNLTAVKSQKLSAEDDRASAAGVGYVGITLFILVFGLIFVLDLTSLYRDLKIFCANWRIGFNRLHKWMNKRKADQRTNENEFIEMGETVTS